jgi:outer membrane protein assembly factor BamA
MTVLGKKYFFIIILGLSLFLASCAGSRSITDEKLLIKNKIETNDDKLSKGDLDNLIVQKPNTNLFSYPWKARFYNSRIKKKDTKFNRWLIRTFGEKPVVYDRSASETTVRQMSRYLDNKGYFDRKISYKAKPKGNKNIDVNYIISVDVPYTIRKINYDIKDSLVRDIVFSINEDSYLREGMNYDAYLLDDERDRVTEFMRNSGYYYFNKDLITYTVDSTLGNRGMELNVRFEGKVVKDENGQLVEVPHTQFKINEIFVYPEYDPLFDPNSYDTLSFYYRYFPRDTVKTRINFLHTGDFRVKPMPMARSVMFKEGEFYNLKGISQTAQRFGAMNITKYVKLDFEDTEIVDSLGYGNLNLHIRQNNKPVHYFANGTEATNSAGYPGLALNITYLNRNVFKGAESFRLTTVAAMEAQPSNASESVFMGFNTIEAGVTGVLELPKFLLPISADRFSTDFNPQTNLGMGYNYQRRSNYTRYIFNVSIGYKWKAKKYVQHIFTPWELNSVKIYVTDEEFKDLLSEFDKRFQEQYTDHLISAMRYSYMFNNQDRKSTDHSLVRWNIESSGNVFDAFNNLTNQSKNSDGVYDILDIRYAQYLRTDLDYRYYKNLEQDRSIALRGIFGIGVPFGNSDALPFEKGFFVGGANGMRGWIMRDLGPGGYDSSGDKYYDKVGDLKIEMNAEYRFPIQGFFHGAVFMDAGNIWLLQESSDYENGHFQFGEFYKQIAMDTGLGLRMDFEFFIFRVDAAIQVRNPSATGSKWVIWDEIQQFGNVHWNFGIGHTF